MFGFVKVWIKGFGLARVYCAALMQDRVSNLYIHYICRVDLAILRTTSLQRSRSEGISYTCVSIQCVCVCVRTCYLRGAVRVWCDDVTPGPGVRESSCKLVLEVRVEESGREMGVGLSKPTI